MLYDSTNKTLRRSDAQTLVIWYQSAESLVQYHGRNAVSRIEGIPNMADYNMCIAKMRSMIRPKSSDPKSLNSRNVSQRGVVASRWRKR